ncbi:MAG: PilZ domain-containing protein [Planctomycetota bacterium]
MARLTLDRLLRRPAGRLLQRPVGRFLRRPVGRFQRAARAQGVRPRIARALEAAAHEVAPEEPERILASRPLFEVAAMRTVVGESDNLELSFGLVDALATTVEDLGLARASDVPDPFRRVWVTSGSGTRIRGVVLTCSGGEVAVFCPASARGVSDIGRVMWLGYRGFSSSVEYDLQLDDAVRLPGALVLHLIRRGGRGAIGRMDERYPTRLAGHVRRAGGGDRSACTVIDISAGGVAVECAQTFRQHEELRLDVRLPDDEQGAFSTLARVCWSSAGQTGSTLGLSFLDLPRPLAQRLGSFLQRLASQPDAPAIAPERGPADAVDSAHSPVAHSPVAHSPVAPEPVSPEPVSTGPATPEPTAPEPLRLRESADPEPLPREDPPAPEPPPPADPVGIEAHADEDLFGPDPPREDPLESDPFGPTEGPEEGAAPSPIPVEPLSLYDPPAESAAPLPDDTCESGSEERDLAAAVLARVADTLTAGLGHDLTCETAAVQRVHSRAAGHGGIHLSFRLALELAGDQRHGCLLIPYAEAFAMASAWLGEPDQTLSESRALKAPSQMMKTALLDLCEVVASAVQEALGTSPNAGVSVLSAGCQGVRAGVRPAFPYRDGDELMLARASTSFAGGPPFELLLMLPTFAA